MVLALAGLAGPAPSSWRGRGEDINACRGWREGSIPRWWQPQFAPHPSLPLQTEPTRWACAWTQRQEKHRDGLWWETIKIWVPLRLSWRGDTCMRLAGVNSRCWRCFGAAWMRPCPWLPIKEGEGAKQDRKVEVVLLPSLFLLSEGEADVNLAFSWGNKTSSELPHPLLNWRTVKGKVTFNSRKQLALCVPGLGLCSKAWFISTDRFQGHDLDLYHKMLLKRFQAKSWQSSHNLLPSAWDGRWQDLLKCWTSSPPTWVNWMHWIQQSCLSTCPHHQSPLVLKQLLALFSTSVSSAQGWDADYQIANFNYYLACRKQNQLHVPLPQG